MSAVSRLSAPSRVRSVVTDMLIAAPLAFASDFVLSTFVGWQMSALVAAGIIALAFAVAMWRARRFNSLWLIRRLNEKRADMEDSADLLFAGDTSLNALQRLQRERLVQRLMIAGPDLRPAWRLDRFLFVLGICCLIVAAVAFVRSGAGLRNAVDAVVGQAGQAGAPVLVSQELHITPPAYTGLPARTDGSLDIKAPVGSRVAWRLHFAPQAQGVDLILHDGRRIAMQRSGDDWIAAIILDRPSLYRIAVQGAKPSALHRLDAVADAPPQVKVIVPEHSLSLVTQGQKTWPLVFEASDDYAVNPTATLHLTLAEGEGENITFHDHVVSVHGFGHGSGNSRTLRFATNVDLTALGFASGDDLVAQLTVSDTRSPAPQVVHGPSLILRWPSNLGTESTGIEGIVDRTMPAYFRSERQIIIDAEALMKAKKSISSEEFLKRSDSIGNDQHILRLRYGQFLGEEAEGDKNDPDQNGSAQPPAAPAAGLGVDNGIEQLYGHTHDEPEAATLLDPDTRATLKQALDEMWQAELHLRQGHPDLALPHAYKALAFIKKVQQATRIYLSRVGPDLPQIDETRRMTGKRDGLASRSTDVTPLQAGDGAVAAAWSALADAPGAVAQPDLAPLEAWLRSHEARVSDPLALYAAIDSLRAEPGCAACRVTLRGLLWAVLSRPPAHVSRRPAGTAAGSRYLDALGGN